MVLAVRIYKQVRRRARMCALELQLASCVSAESKTLTKVQDPKQHYDGSWFGCALSIDSRFAFASGL